MDGNAHQRATLALTAVIGATAVVGIAPQALALPAAAGALAGLWCHPDRDLPAAKIDRQFGILGLPGALIWTPYAYIVKHRSRLSHWPIVGTIGRIVYLAALAGVFAALIRPRLLLEAFSWLHAPHPWLISGVAGLAASDAIHWVMDKS